VVAVAVTAATASATLPPSVQQYVEMLPTSGGSVSATEAIGGQKQRRLAPALARAIHAQAGSDAAPLTAIAESAPPAAKDSRQQTPTETTDSKKSKPVATAASRNIEAAASSSSGFVDGRSGWILALVGAIVAAAAGGALYARTRR
jgi:cobalamin biosynthesis Mg chelatase CobN